MGLSEQSNLNVKAPASATGQFGQNGGRSPTQQRVSKPREDWNANGILGSGQFAPITMSVVSYVKDLALDTIRHARMTTQSKGVRELVELQAAYLQDRIETNAAYTQEVVELARGISFCRSGPVFSATKTRSTKN